VNIGTLEPFISAGHTSKLLTIPLRKMLNRK